jgi:hypothetical protein
MARVFFESYLSSTHVLANWFLYPRAASHWTSTSFHQVKHNRYAVRYLEDPNSSSPLPLTKFIAVHRSVQFICTVVSSNLSVQTTNYSLS